MIPAGSCSRAGLNRAAVWTPALTAALALAAAPVGAQQTADRIPLVAGLVLGSALHSSVGEREDLLEVVSADTRGVHYAWHERMISRDGDTTTGFRKRFVRASDLAGAPRFDDIFGSEEVERPGFTAVSVSSAVYRQLRDTGSTAYSLMMAPHATNTPNVSHAALAGLLAPERMRYKGALTRMSRGPEPFPLLLNGRRATVPALHLHGNFADGLRRSEWELWVQADSTHPLLLKSILDGEVFQMVRADLPPNLPARDGVLSPGARGLEGALDAGCRVELPGVYFAFGTATIDPISDRALAELARMLGRHPDWTFTVEGHTDSIGTTAANQALSQRRADAVLARLAERHGVDSHAWGAVGYGATRPKESNSTIEGRARNRRVELVRDCR